MNWLDLIGWAGSALLVWSLLQTRILRLRVFNLIGCVVLIFFNAAVGVWPMVGLNVVLAVINIVYLSRMLWTRHDERAYAVVEVEPDDAFLTYVLDVHAEDIERFNPGFKRSGKELAFLVMHEDALAGVVLMYDYGDGHRADRAGLCHATVPRLHPGRVRLQAKRPVHRTRLPPRRHPARHGLALLRPHRFPRVGDVYVLEM